MSDKERQENNPIGEALLSRRPHRPEYFDVCHPGKGESHAAIVLWIYDGKIKTRSAKGGKEHDSFWKGSFLGSGRIDTVKRVGILGIAADAGSRKARRIAEDVIARFPGVRFWVFYGSDYGATMQEFWDVTS